MEDDDIVGIEESATSVAAFAGFSNSKNRIALGEFNSQSDATGGDIIAPASSASSKVDMTIGVMQQAELFAEPLL